MLLPRVHGQLTQLQTRLSKVICLQTCRSTEPKRVWLQDQNKPIMQAAEHGMPATIDGLKQQQGAAQQTLAR